MSAPRDRVNEIFLAALEREPHDRAAFVADACGGDAALRREVESLLEAHAAANGFLEQPAAVLAGLVPASPPSLVGRRVGPYQVEAEIGRGGMGVVYLAEDTRLGRRVALKALSPERVGDERRREWLRREARAAGALSHPGIATVYALEDIDGQFFIASEYVPGRTLREHLGPHGLAAPALIDIALQVARALEAAHARGVVHRDLKPENVICRPDGTVSLVDFGVARVDDARGPGERLTEAGLVAGTPAYMSPEQIEGGPVDFRSDLFSFGILVYEMASGANPFAAPTPLATAARVASAEPPPLSAAGSGAPPGLERIARRCLRKRREDRYPSTPDLVADLETLAARAPIRMRRPRGVPTASPDGATRATWSARAWWAIHQVVVLAFYAVMIVPMWIVQAWAGSHWALALVGAYIAAAVANGVLRGHLLFIHQVTPSELPVQLAWSGPWVRRSDGVVLLLMLLGAAVAAATGHGPTALLLAAVGVALLVVALVIEPATTSAAFPGPRGRHTA